MNELLVYLLVIVLVVPLSKRIGLGSVMGYLIAGALIGPQGMGLLHADANTSAVAEFGVIMMLLVIGLELSPQLLWKMRGPIFGMGSLQVLGTTLLFFVALLILGDSWKSSLALGLIVAVSSTAIVLQTLQEQGYAKSTGGERAFAVLLFQDIAIIPILALISFLGAASTPSESDPLKTTGLIVGSIVVVLGTGRFILRPLFRAIARVRLRETFTTLALLIVVAAAALMHAVGLSPALGAFLAGVALADSEFKHQIEADIEPFKGLLLGLFFITIGSGIRFDLILAEPATVVAWVAAILLGKAALCYGIARACRLRPPESLLFAVSLAQGGEFAFVLLGHTAGVISPTTVQILTAAIALSMAVAPLLISLAIRHGMSRLECVKPEERLPDTVDETEKDNPILVVGVGRFGQTLIRFLRANGYASTVLDIDSEQIEVMSRFGIKSYFGDGSNLDLLRAAGLERCRVLVLAIDEPESAIRIATDVRREYPHLPIYCRAYDRVHAYRLLHLGVTEVAVETSGSAIALATEILHGLGMSESKAQSKALLFQTNNNRSIRHLAKRYHEDDRETFIQASKQMSEQLEAILKTDAEELSRGASSEWTPPANRV